MEVFTRAAFNQLPDGTDTRASFTFEPLARGFGTTIGNAICRTLISDLPGTAVVGLTIDGVGPEDHVIEKLEEDVVRLRLNAKAVRLNGDEDGLMELTVSAQGPAEITAGDLNVPESVTIMDPDHVICHLKDGEHLDMTLFAANGTGYHPAADIASEYPLPEGTISLDTTFTPIRSAEYLSEPTLLGHETKYDKVTFDIHTNGSITPMAAITEAARIVIEYLDVIVPFADMHLEESFMVQQPVAEENVKSSTMMIEDLELSVRSYNCLKRAGIQTVEELTQKTEDEMMHVKNLGKKSLQEVKERLESMGLGFRQFD
ncbi:DNA-directed RNA polymerase subunit alpha [Allobaculum mucilyticum]|uniref:DNA-directed RNA polymerase subunit alpha n=1 Tax=Allobaculum mucilyticum TaxID=2834459 RepID=UPI001E2850D7|nr:DNA-directed RNA polymerase subunit alpha [Allobaculum mucilyticum]UNT95439.1 DNA-directed RNA polymerase subunit alpha [Allobaculum mucilyticum]